MALSLPLRPLTHTDKRFMKFLTLLPTIRYPDVKQKKLQKHNSEDLKPQRRQHSALLCWWKIWTVSLNQLISFKLLSSHVLSLLIYYFRELSNSNSHSALRAKPTLQWFLTSKWEIVPNRLSTRGNYDTCFGPNRRGEEPGFGLQRHWRNGGLWGPQSAVSTVWATP